MKTQLPLFSGNHRFISTLKATPDNRASELLKKRQILDFGNQLVSTLRPFIDAKMQEDPNGATLTMDLYDGSAAKIVTRNFEENGFLGAELVVTGDEALVSVIDAQIRQDLESQVKTMNQLVPQDRKPGEEAKYTFTA